LKKTIAVCLFFTVLFPALLSCKQPQGGTGETGNPDIFSWRTASWSPFTSADSVKGFAWGGGLYVAAGLHGIIAYSHDGDIWERARKAPDPDSGESPPAEPFKLAGGGSANFNAVAFGGGVFIAVADGGHLAYSRDGVSWTGIHEAAGFGSEDIKGIAYGEAPGGPGCFVAVGNGANSGANISAALSSNPESWAGGSVAGFSALKDAAFGNGTFYVAGDEGWMGWASAPSPNPAPPAPANTWDWHPRQWTFSAPAGSFRPYVKKIAFGEYGQGTPGLGLAFNAWGGKRLAICAADRFESGDSAAWDSDIDAGFFGQEVNGIVWSPRDSGTWLAAGTSAMIGYWPSADPGDEAERYWRTLSFAEFRWWEITSLALLNGRYFAGGIGGKIGYNK
jgi:hypothetical protein